MKKIISSILIYALLIQTGCYSEKWISTEDLKEAEGNKIHVITYDKSEYEGTSDDWSAKNDTLFINKPTQKIIPYDSINKVYKSGFDTVNTISLILLIGTFALILLGLRASAQNIRINF